MNFDRGPSKPPRLVEHHRNREGFLAASAWHAPDPERRSPQPLDEYRNHQLDDGSDLVDFPPEISFWHRQHVHHSAPFTRGGVVIPKQIVVVEEGLESLVDDER